MPDDGQRLRVLAISHAAVVDVNQEPFAALEAHDVDVTLIVPEELETDIRGRVALERLPAFKGTLVPLKVAIGGFRPVIGQRGIHLIWYRGLEHAIRAATPDVIFLEEEPYSLAAWQVLRALRARAVPLVVHENQNIARSVPFPFGRVRSAVLRRAAGVTVRNEAAGELVRSLGFTGPVGSFPHGVDVSRFEGNRSQTELPAPVIGFVGRLVAEKGILDLFEAVGRVRARVGAASLLVVGDGPLREEARARATQLGIPAEFTGSVPHHQVPSWYASMDVVAVPSHTTRTWKEQFGRIVIEANAAGVPVVTSDSGELPETVRATGGGIVVPEGDIALLASALARVVEDPAWAATLGRAGRDAVASRFTPEAIAARFAEFLHEVAR